MRALVSPWVQEYDYLLALLRLPIPDEVWWDLACRVIAWRCRAAQLLNWLAEDGDELVTREAEEAVNFTSHSEWTPEELHQQHQSSQQLPCRAHVKEAQRTNISQCVTALPEVWDPLLRPPSFAFVREYVVRELVVFFDRHNLELTHAS